MKCAYCGHGKTKVVDTRDSSEKVRRRRECKECSRRFTTYETAETLDIKVVKDSGEVEKFNEEKVREGIQKAAKNTDIDDDQIEVMVEEVKEGIRGKKKVEAQEIGCLVKDALKERNEVAYIRFASVYDSFESAESFKEEVQALEKE
jgi:transcriptional repressor NrdR